MSDQITHDQLVVSHHTSRLTAACGEKTSAAEKPAYMQVMQ